MLLLVLDGIPGGVIVLIAVITQHCSLEFGVGIGWIPSGIIVFICCYYTAFNLFTQIGLGIEWISISDNIIMTIAVFTAFFVI